MERPPRPGPPLFANPPPCAPKRSKLALVTPAGTTQVWGAPVYIKVSVVARAGEARSAVKAQANPAARATRWTRCPCPGIIRLDAVGWTLLAAPLVYKRNRFLVGDVAGERRGRYAMPPVQPPATAAATAWAAVISARLAPLPPSSARISREPSGKP